MMHKDTGAARAASWIFDGGAWRRK